MPPVNLKGAMLLTIPKASVANTDEALPVSLSICSNSNLAPPRQTRTCCCLVKGEKLPTIAWVMPEGGMRVRLSTGKRAPNRGQLLGITARSRQGSKVGLQCMVVAEVWLWAAGIKKTEGSGQ